MRYRGYKWKLINENRWRFGRKVRGAVLDPVAEVFFDEDTSDPDKFWRWIVNTKDPEKDYEAFGFAENYSAAVRAVEEVLGLRGPKREPDDLEASCKRLAEMFHVLIGERDDPALQKRICWNMAVFAYEFIEGTKVESVLWAAKQKKKQKRVRDTKSLSQGKKEK